jgi:hypothetical protein
MAVTAFWYANALEFLLTRAKNIDIDTNNIKVSLHTSAYTPNQDTHEDFDDLTNEVTGTGYSAGGDTPGSETVTQTANVIYLDGADPEWTGASFTAAQGVWFDDSGATDADKALIIWMDFDGDQVVSSGTFTIQQDANGYASLTAADA